MNKLLKISTILFSIIICTSVHIGFANDTEIIKNQQRYKEAGIMMDPKDFLEISLNNKIPNKCSPLRVPDLYWRGIVIRAPRKVSFNKSSRIMPLKTFVVIPICGWCRINISASPEPFMEQLIAKNIKTGEIYSGQILNLDQDPSPIVPPPDDNDTPLTEDSVKGVGVEEYFNYNLADFVKLPEEAGIYEVYDEIDGVRSNTVTIEIVEETDEEEEK